MNKIAKSAIIKGRELVFEGDTTFSQYEKRYPLSDVKSCHYLIKANRHNDIIVLSFQIKGILNVFDTRTNKLFDYPINIKEETEVLSDEDWDNEGYIVPGANIDLDDLTLRIIQSSLPLRLVKDEKEPLPEGIKGVSLLKEDEAKEERENFSLDGLPSFPSKEDKQ